MMSFVLFPTATPSVVISKTLFHNGNILRMLARSSFAISRSNLGLANATVTRAFSFKICGGVKSQKAIEENEQRKLTKFDPQHQELFIHSCKPKMVRSEFISKKLNSEELENLKIGLDYHRKPEGLRDHFAYRLVKLLRTIPDFVFKKKYVHRAVVLETVAGVPGMVAGMLRHLTSLRKMQHDGGWIQHLLDEAENERMHLMVWMRVSQPVLWEKLVVLSVQAVFFNAYFLLYLLTPATCHRVVGYLEEEAVVSYTQFLKEIDEGRIANGPAPQIAIDYWNMKEDATIRDVVLAVRADEAKHRDVNHHLCDRIIAKRENLRDDFDT
eukprot:Nk52_evm12s2152 gene=Nk52_evmTU12s2152